MPPPAEDPGQDAVAFLSVVAQAEHYQASDDAQNGTAGGTYPVVIEGEFQEVTDADDDR